MLLRLRGKNLTLPQNHFLNTLCGIIGYAPKRSERGIKVILDCLSRLEYRGYDSVGVASLNELGIEIRKGKGQISEVGPLKGFSELRGYLFLGHTRWATHGVPSDINAHPHSDCTGKIAVVHNGIISNFDELRKNLMEKNHTFKSETDTEVFSHLFEEFLSNGLEAFEAFTKALSLIKGTYALASVVQGDDRIFFAVDGPPLVLGISDDGNFISSDVQSILPYTNKVIHLRDGEKGWISKNSIEVFDRNGKRVNIKERIVVINWSPAAVSKENFQYYMLKEIHEEPLAVRQTIEANIKNEVIEKVKVEIGHSDNVFIVAAGSSYYSSLMLQLYLAFLAKRLSNAIVASEFYNYKNLVNKNTVVIAISQSGETADVLRAVKEFKEMGGKVVGITNVMGSRLYQMSDYPLTIRSGPEMGVAATKTFISQVAISFLLSLKTSTAMGKLKEGEEKNYLDKIFGLPKLISKVIMENEGKVTKVSGELAKAKSMYYLARWVDLPIAMEGALKLKEIAYIHAEAYPAGESKHGPIALVDEEFPIITLSSTLPYEHLKSNAIEMAARGAKIYHIGIKPLGIGEQYFQVPTLDPLLEPLLLTPIVHLIAYYTSVKKGLNPDRPRNLAKSVTVD
jgi:glucosamine--fructose-6-phosphate aminotransferase (isomerizing)